MAGRKDASIGGGGLDPELHLSDRVDLEHADEKAAEKFKPREDDFDPSALNAKGSSGEKVCNSYKLTRVNKPNAPACKPSPKQASSSSKVLELQAASGAADAVRESGTGGADSHDNKAAAVAAGVKAATEGK